MADDISQYLQGLQILGGILALPRSAQYAQQDVLQKRQLLKDTGMDDAEISKVLPDAPLQWLSPGQGIGGKVLGGVGDVGALLSTIAGQPIGPPRASISDLAAASKMRKQFKESQAYDELAKNVSDPVEAGLIRAGALDAAGRVHSAALRNQPGDFGKSDLGTRARLAWLKQNKPDSTEIPALEKAIADEERLHPAATPPLTADQRVDLARREQAARHDEIMQTRKREAEETYGYKPGTDEYNYFLQHGSRPPLGPQTKDLDYNYFYKQALETEQGLVKGGFKSAVDLDLVQQNAQGAWDNFKKGKEPKGGASVGYPSPAPTGPPPKPQTPPAAEASYGGPPPAADATSGKITMATPEQLAARQSMVEQAQRLGVDPRSFRDSNQALWAASGMAGTENLPTEQFYQLLSDPMAFARWQAEQAQLSEPPPSETPMGVTSEVTGKAMSPEGLKELQALQAEVQAGVSPQRKAQIAIRLHQLQ